MKSDIPVYLFDEEVTHSLKTSPIVACRELYKKCSENGWFFDTSQYHKMGFVYLEGKSGWLIPSWRFRYSFTDKLVNYGVEENMMLLDVSLNQG